MGEHYLTGDRCLQESTAYRKAATRRRQTARAARCRITRPPGAPQQVEGYRERGTTSRTLKRLR